MTLFVGGAAWNQVAIAIGVMKLLFVARGLLFEASYCARSFWHGATFSGDATSSDVARSCWRGAAVCGNATLSDIAGSCWRGANLCDNDISSDFARGWGHDSWSCFLWQHHFEWRCWGVCVVKLLFVQGVVGVELLFVATPLRGTLWLVSGASMALNGRKIVSTPRCFTLHGETASAYVNGFPFSLSLTLSLSFLSHVSFSLVDRESKDFHGFESCLFS